MPYNVAENLVECGGTGQGIEPAGASESRPVSCPDGFFVGPTPSHYRKIVPYFTGKLPQP
jgi:hypothetical protein